MQSLLISPPFAPRDIVLASHSLTLYAIDRRMLYGGLHGGGALRYITTSTCIIDCARLLLQTAELLCHSPPSSRGSSP